ncbi:MAG TPA: phage Gp37/Gp68 family protein [Anaerolineales bacterium]
MGETTGVEWADSTWNSWIACQKISPGCKNCYMYRDMVRWGQDPTDVRRTGDETFYAPLKWKEPRRIFAASWSDFFIEQADAWRDDAWDVIRRTRHTYMILTKRPENIPDRLPADWGDGWPHVWLGVSAETQEYANRRIPLLLRVPARLKFLSCEPLLGPISLGYAHPCGYYCDPAIGHVDHDFWTPGISTSIKWVIAGGESGPQARPMDLDWARSLRDQCEQAGTAFFFKQVGGHKKINGVWGGDVLDGQRHHQWPQSAAGQPETTDAPPADQLRLF